LEFVPQASTGEGGVDEHVSNPSDQNEGASGNDRAGWIKSVGEIAAPLLAGFSFTTVIAISGDADRFRWPGLTVLALTFASVLLILAVQSAKYADPKRQPAAEGHWSAERWHLVMRNSYHAGIVALLLGLAFALAPKQATAGQDVLRWAASYLAFAGCGAEFLVFITHLRGD
jgi:hypothetical protein